MSKLIMCIVGQTASGKSLAAMQIAKRLPISIISVDSAMVYQGCDIGTAKPSIADQAQVPHYLLDLIDPSQSYSVAQFMGDVDHAIQSVQAAGRIPLLVGGSMMYFHTLIHGISSLPATDMSVRQEVEALIESNGLSYVWEALEQVDPEAAARIHPHDRQRIIRAYGLYLQTGHSMKRLLQLSPPRQLPYDFQLFEKACRDLTELEGNIRRRVQIMMSQGLVEEATLIYDQLKGIATPAKKLIGYHQIYQMFEGRVKHDALEDLIVNATKQYAKRQRTWLNGLRSRCLCERLFGDSLSEKILKVLQKEWRDAL